MAEFAALPLFTDSWVADTAHLGRAERGLYHDLLVLMWRSPECRVPNEIEWIMRRLSCTEAERSVLLSIVSEFCVSDSNWITQKRLKKEFEYVRLRAKKQSVRAKSRWNKDKTTCHGNATGGTEAAMPPHPHPHPHPQDLGDITLKASERLERQLREAAGWENEPSPNLCVTGPIEATIEAGAILETDVLPVIRALASKARSRSSWKFFIPAIIAARDDRLAALTAVSPPQPTGNFNGSPPKAKPSRRNNLAMVDAAIAELERREAESSA